MYPDTLLNRYAVLDALILFGVIAIVWPIPALFFPSLLGIIFALPVGYFALLKHTPPESPEMNMTGRWACVVFSQVWLILTWGVVCFLTALALIIHVITRIDRILYSASLLMGYV